MLIAVYRKYNRHNNFVPFHVYSTLALTFCFVIVVNCQGTHIESQSAKSIIHAKVDISNEAVLSIASKNDYR